MTSINKKRILHVEVCLKSLNKKQDLIETSLRPVLIDYIDKLVEFEYNQQIPIEEGVHEDLRCIDTILLEPEYGVHHVYLPPITKLRFHFFCPQKREMELEMFNTNDYASGDQHQANEVTSFNHWLLPSKKFIGLWESLIFEHGLKEKLLRFALTALSFGRHNINSHLIACNRMLLLHGPPGTGKTSLAKALAQKLCIRARGMYRQTHLIEINSHSLFSKWFSESGKLVMRLFQKIHEIVDDKRNLVCLLIDEVESLAYARDSMSSTEPKDAMRVVNAMLTQLDAIKDYPNVLVLATSNLASTIDLAFLDRVDIKQYIGLPRAPALLQIFTSAITELLRVGILTDDENVFESMSSRIKHIAQLSVGISGRAARKLPFLAHALHSSSIDFSDDSERIDLDDYFKLLLAALEKYLEDCSSIKGEGEKI